MDLVKGIKEVSGAGILQSDVMTFRVIPEEVSKHAPGTHPEKHSHTDHYSGMDPEHLIGHIMEHTQNEHQLFKWFIILGNAETVTTVLEAAEKKEMVRMPYRWLVVLTEPVTSRSYWNRLGPILSKSDTALVQREVSPYGECGQMREGCQLSLAFHTLNKAMHALLESATVDPLVSLKSSHSAGRIKNRILANMKVG